VQITRFAAQHQVFWALHTQLLRAYAGKYVPGLNGQVVDCDEDKCALAKRLYGRMDTSLSMCNLRQQVLRSSAR
jgi:hypothetical protein